MLVAVGVRVGVGLGVGVGVGSASVGLAVGTFVGSAVGVGVGVAVAVAVAVFCGGGVGVGTTIVAVGSGLGVGVAVAVGVGVGWAAWTVSNTVTVTAFPEAGVNCTSAEYGVVLPLSLEAFTENVTFVEAPDLPLPLSGETLNQDGALLTLHPVVSPPLLVIVND